MYAAFSVLKSFSLVIRMSPFLLVQGRHLSHGKLIPCFQGHKGAQSPSGTGCFSNNFNSR